jgi:hypothetical protein
MRYLVVLMALAVLGFSGAALAEPISRASDSAPVNLTVACWVDIHFENGENADFYLEVEALDGGADDVEDFIASHNCPAVVTGLLTPPPGAPGTWSWRFIGDGQQLNLPGAGVLERQVKVSVRNITINDPAGIYPGGQMEIFIACVD